MCTPGLVSVDAQYQLDTELDRDPATDGFGSVVVASATSRVWPIKLFDMRCCPLPLELKPVRLRSASV